LKLGSHTDVETPLVKWIRGWCKGLTLGRLLSTDKVL
jgi:hypothetical protein